MPKLENLVGRTFGRLTVTEHVGAEPGNTLWRCLCECDTEVVVRRGSLKQGRTKSCGCLQRELAVARKTTHGLSKTRAYKAWTRMRKRCYRPSEREAARYFGRGITVCDRWLESFANFLADMGECPDGLTLERTDNDGNYEPSNCAWATVLTQSRNKEPKRDLHPGVHHSRNGKFVVKIGLNNKSINLGTFDKYEDAVAARKLGEENYWK